jgi:hypothetical protein
MIHPVKRTFLITFLSLFLLSGLVALPGTAAEKDWKVYITESWFAYPSHIGVRVPDSTDPFGGNTFNCPEWGVGDCALVSTPTNSIFGTVVLPPCSEPKATFCVESVEFREPGGQWQKSEFVRSVFAPTHEAIPSIGYPYGGSIGLWKSSVKHAGGTGDYAVQAVLELSEVPVSRGQVEFRTLDLRVEPFTAVEGVYTEQVVQSIASTDPTTGKKKNTLAFTAYDVWQDRLGKATKARWSPNTGSRVTARIPDSLTGWLGGRLTDVDFAVSKYSEGINRLVIGGNAVTVQSVEATVPDSEIRKVTINPDLELPNNSARMVGYRGSDGFFPILEKIKPFTNDQAIGDMSLWVVQTFGAQGEKCLADKSRLMGVVTTNAVMYDKFAPKFVDDRLKYAVGGLHRDKDGNLVKGNYDLVLRSDAARCLYGFSDAPIEAVVSVTYGDKEQNISTTASGERDGWLFISAKNFTFSNPTIEVAISQPKATPAASATPTPTPTVAATPNKVVKLSSKMTISCVKGTTVKKVTGKSPKCPKGFKKRA